ncbi:hypothetical protein TBC1_121032 [Lentimicrobium saccharophilum]|uniref:Uncharacterized protein n=1 Tax=Lentimicrobium saccharophilum TaxID=1678841 RepID=A0A0S7C2G6_9BACT|nr:hypothetical protein [Lentimicrobium saccharophilum]GAP45211.1 hypothetical protein TBC1_121032 [Lentimicrobium saccharophilum]
MESRKINRQNYEEYISDYLDGTAGPVEAAELLLFLEQNPDIKEEVEGINEIVLSNESQTGYPFKEALKAGFDQDAELITEENSDYYFIAFHENDLSEAGKRNVESFLNSHPSLRAGFELFAGCKVAANQEIKFPDREKIKKPVPIISMGFMHYAVLAASILILISVYLRIQPEGEDAIRESLGGYETPVIIEQPAVTGMPSAHDDETVTAPSEQANKKVPEINTARPAAPEIQRQPPLERIPIREGNLNVSEPFIGNARDLYSGLYDDIRLSQEILLAYYEETNSEPTEKKGFSAGRHLPGLIRSGAQVINQVPESLNAWMLADLGINGFNMITDNELKLERQINPSGKTENVRLLNGETAYSLRRNPN